MKRTLPKRYETGIQHARYYREVADATQQLYLEGGTSLITALQLFDADRGQIDQAQTWAGTQTGRIEAEELMVNIVNATTYIGDLRYNQPAERILRLRRAQQIAQRHGHNEAEIRLLSLLGNAQIPQRICFASQITAVARLRQVLLII